MSRPGYGGNVDASLPFHGCRPDPGRVVMFGPLVHSAGHQSATATSPELGDGGKVGTSDADFSGSGFPRLEISPPFPYKYFMLPTWLGPMDRPWNFSRSTATLDRVWTQPIKTARLRSRPLPNPVTSSAARLPFLVSGSWGVDVGPDWRPD